LVSCDSMLTRCCQTLLFLPLKNTCLLSQIVPRYHADMHLARCHRQYCTWFPLFCCWVLTNDSDHAHVITLSPSYIHYYYIYR
jgi:hypothetical protein